MGALAVNIRTMTVTYSRTFNLGNYNSARLEIAIGADLDPEDNAIEVEALLWQQAKMSLKEQAMPLLRRNDEEASDAS